MKTIESLFHQTIANNWSNDTVKQSGSYYDLETNSINFVDINNVSFLETIFKNDFKYNYQEISERYGIISSNVLAIYNFKILNQKQALLTNGELLLFKHFFFLQECLNGNYKFYFEDYQELFSIREIFKQNFNQYVKRYLMGAIYYMLFDFYDKCNWKTIFKNIYDYIELTNYEIFTKKYEKWILFPRTFVIDLDWRFIDVYFQHFVNNSIIKIVNNKNANASFCLTDNVIADFVDNRTEMSVISFLPLSPTICIGFVNLGPGKGVLHPFFTYFKTTYFNTELFPGLLDETTTDIKYIGIEIDKKNIYEVKIFNFNANQVNLVNDKLLGK